MKKDQYSRSQFIKSVALAGISLKLPSVIASSEVTVNRNEKKKAGIIGLDTEHSIAFIQFLNDENARDEFSDYKVIAAYPYGSRDIKSSAERIPGYTAKAQKLNVEIVDSIEKLLEKVDVVFLETNDGRMHVEQALKVIKAGKPVFIDKPMAVSLSEGLAIVEASKKYRVPIFSSSPVRYISNVQEVVHGKVGKVIGANTFSPAKIEKTHPDLFWYGIHGIEILYTVMGTGCKSVARFHVNDTDVVVGMWEDDRIGTFRGTRSGEGGYGGYGGTVFGEKENGTVGPFEGYKLLLLRIIEFFKTGISPVKPE
ncbi:MAG: Gfo/Idh/MocA family protein, partial [Ginsengibacter sp.]